MGKRELTDEEYDELNRKATLEIALALDEFDAAVLGEGEV